MSACQFHQWESRGASHDGRRELVECARCGETKTRPFREPKVSCLHTWVEDRDDPSVDRCARCDQTRPAKVRSSKPRRGSTLKDSGFTGASEAQRQAVAEQGFCIGCGEEASEWVVIDPAHLTPRSKGGCDHKLCVVGLCRNPATGAGCHRKFDDGELDLLSIVAARWPAEREQWQHMAEHLNPVQALEQLANERTQWTTVAA